MVPDDLLSYCIGVKGCAQSKEHRNKDTSLTKVDLTTEFLLLMYMYTCITAVGYWNVEYSVCLCT